VVNDYVENVSPGSRPETLIATRLRVLSWNIWWRFGPWRERAPLILRVLEAVDADLLCLQEVWQAGGDNQARQIADALGFHHVYGSVLAYSGVDWGMAILARWPIMESEDIRLVSMPSEDGSRDCRVLRARVDGPRGAIDAYCTHLSWRPEESHIRQKQVAAVAEWVRDTAGGGYPPVVCGDFNAIPTSDEIRMMTGEAICPVDGLVFYDAWRAAGHTEPGFTWDNANPHTNEALRPDRRLDYVFVGEPVDGGAGHVLTAELVGTVPTDGLFPSDHFGVVAEVRY
jgi:endonuclease/exonuclease/phosphatase family metal-dependent hydrolase